MGIKRGIIQSRGLGDIIIALPIAKWYADQGDTIYWPICREFIGSFERSVPWVQWIPMDTDAQGQFFFNTPLSILEDLGCDQDEILYLYQFLNVRPDLTDPELFNILKFDQYKYWVSQVPFRRKWTLADCIQRDPVREQALYDQVVGSTRDYAVAHLEGSNFKARVDLSFLDPAVVFTIDPSLSSSIFDWLMILEHATSFVGVDSVFANLVDSLSLPIENLYWIRRSGWDLTPVLGSAWTIVPTDLPIVDPRRVDPARMAQEFKARTAAPADHGTMKSHAPFQASGTIPTSFMSALKK